MVFNAAMLAKAHDKICDGTATQDDILAEAGEAFEKLFADCGKDDELTAIHIYQLFTSKKASKVSW